MKINNFTLYYIAVLMLLSQSVWAKPVVFLAIPLILFLLLKSPLVSKFVVSKLAYLLSIILIGFISGVLHLPTSDVYFFTRDILYFIQAPMFILLGVLIYFQQCELKTVLKVIVITSTAVTLYLLIELVTNPNIIFNLGLNTKYEFSLSNPNALFTFLIVFYARRLHYPLFSNRTELFLLSISLLSIVVSFSRTSYFILLITAMLPLINNNFVRKLYWGSVLLVLFVIFGCGILDLESDGKYEQTFQSKIAYSLNEMTVRKYTIAKEINENWRGYEAYLGLAKYSEGNLAEMIVGQGFGSVANTPFWVFQGKKLDVIPMFHNGYITIILKTGLLGLFFFFTFLYILLRTSINLIETANNMGQRLPGLVLQASVFVIFFQTFVIHGLFKTTVPVLLLVLMGAILQLPAERHEQRAYNV